MQSMSREPLVSIVMGSFNASPYITESIDSVLSQTYANWELIVVDDASTDHTARLVEDVSKRDSRVKLIRREVNSNRPAVARNTGLESATGDFVAFLDHDDLWYPRKLERHVLAHLKRPDIDLTHSAMLNYPNRLELRSFRTLPNPLLQKAGVQELRNWNRIVHSSVVARTNVVRELGGFDESIDLRAIEDYHLWLRFAEVGRLGFIPEVLGKYRVLTHGTYVQADQAKLRVALAATGVLDGAPLKRASGPAALKKFASLPAKASLYGLVGPLRGLRGSPPLVLG